MCRWIKLNNSTQLALVHCKYMPVLCSLNWVVPYVKNYRKKLDTVINSCVHLLLTRFLSQNLSLQLKLSLLESTTCMPYLPCIILAWKMKMLNYFIIIKIVMCDLLEILLCHVVKLWYILYLRKSKILICTPHHCVLYEN